MMAMAVFNILVEYVLLILLHSIYLVFVGILVTSNFIILRVSKLERAVIMTGGKLHALFQLPYLLVLVIVAVTKLPFTMVSTLVHPIVQGLTNLIKKIL